MPDRIISGEYEGVYHYNWTLTQRRLPHSHNNKKFEFTFRLYHYENGIHIEEESSFISTKEDIGIGLRYLFRNL